MYPRSNSRVALCVALLLGAWTGRASGQIRPYSIDPSAAPAPAPSPKPQPPDPAPKPELAAPAATKQADDPAPGPAVPQAVDTESAKELAPLPDPDGRVSFGPKQLDARVGVVSITADRPGVRIYLDGRFFGVAPQTIHSVPTGDYIVEGTFPDGKMVSRPVTVTQDPVTVALIPKPVPGAVVQMAADAPWHMRLKKRTLIVGMVGAGFLMMGGVVGYAEMKKQDEYDRAPLASPADVAHVQDLARSGKNLALLANVLYGCGLAGAVTAAVLGYRDFRPNREPAAGPAPPPIPAPSAMLLVAPGADLASLQAGVLVVF